MGNNFSSLFSEKALSFFKDKATPVYLYSEKQIQKNIENLLGSARKYFPDFHLHYAIKANGNPHILKIIQEAGVFADCSSPVELEIAKRVGFDITQSIYTGNYESTEDIQKVAQYDCVLNLDDGRRLEEFCAVKKPGLISFRINPGIGRGSHEGIVTGGEKAKFGLPHEMTGDAYKKAKDLGITRFGIHIMTGSNVLDTDHFAEVTNRLFDIIEKHISPLGIELDFINIGGGLGVPYTKDESDLDLDTTFKKIRNVFDERLTALNVGQPKLSMEPGRFLVANAGVVLSRAVYIKDSYRKFLGIDCGMSTLLRPAMYKAYHEIEVLNDSKEKEQYYVCGQICENSDVQPEIRTLNKASLGDLVCIYNAGAYGHVMSSNYNHRPRPAEYLYYSNGETKLIREKDSIEDIFKNIPDY